MSEVNEITVYAIVAQDLSEKYTSMMEARRFAREDDSYDWFRFFVDKLDEDEIRKIKEDVLLATGGEVEVKKCIGAGKGKYLAEEIV